jgi:hypothetical protein
VQIRWTFLKRVLAGAIFGLYMAHLLYFLNPQVDITPGRLATVTIIYGAICGLLVGGFLWLLRAVRVKLFGRPDADGEYRAHGFGFVVLAAFVAATVYWIHLDAVRIYLPIGAVRVLAKATNLITAVAFALLLLWVAERNARKTLSRSIFIAGVLLIAISSVFLYERRGSLRTERQNVVVANVGTVAGQRPVIVIAVRNLPYDWILTMIGEGSLPFFDAARTRACFTRIEPFPTTSAQSLWASIATGKLPYRHGVTGRFSYKTPLNDADPSDRFLILPAGVGFDVWGLIPPVQRISAQLPSGDSLPLWSLVERLSFHAAVIDWPAARCCATRVVPDATRFAPQPLERPSQALLQRFNGARAGRARIADALTSDLAAMHVVRDTAADRSFELTIAALDGFSAAQRAIHIFTNDLPSRSTQKGEVLRAYAEELDRMLSELAKDYPDHLIVVVSPCGPRPPRLAATPWSVVRDLIDPPDPSADDGFMLLTGPGIVHRDNVRPALVVDVVPTVLYAAGLPVGRDMDGRVMVDAFTDDFVRRTSLSVIATYEAREVVVRRGG